MAKPGPPGPLGREYQAFSFKTLDAFKKNDTRILPADRQFIGNTPGALGRNDWGDPDFLLDLVRVAGATTSAAFDITKIPGIMRANGWLNGAALMERWFRNPSNDDPAKGIPDTTTIKMDSWALTFARARQVYDEMLAQKVWVNPAAQGQILVMLKRNRVLPLQNPLLISNFGDFFKPVPALDKDYVNFRKVESNISDGVDDMFAALGNFVFRVVVRGSVLLNPGGKHLVFIDEVGIYIQDSYDFNGDQELGFWKDSTKYGGENPLKGTRIQNNHFRQWRSEDSLKGGRGGDFYVFSDLKRIKRNPPDIFTF